MTETPAPDPFQRSVEHTFTRKRDLDVHVGTIEVAEHHYVDLREFIPSMEQYGRGILLPMAELPGVIETLTSIYEGWVDEHGDA